MEGRDGAQNDQQKSLSMSYVSHLECSRTGERQNANELAGVSRHISPLLVRYDLPAIKAAFRKEDLRHRPMQFWRYRELLPIRHTENIVELGEPITPLIKLRSPRLIKRFNLSNSDSGGVYIKDESRLPTCSFKARGIAVAVSMAKELGVQEIAMPTNGNAGAALAAYTRRADMKAHIFCPADTPIVNIQEMAYLGANVYKVTGYINDCGRVVNEARKAGRAWFDMSTCKEPYRIEGKKTMGLELAEQFDWQLPDVIFYPTGGGTGLIGMWKAFEELEAIGWIDSKRPRMVAVQASGCAPIVKAWEEGADKAEVWENAHTVASGIRVPAAFADFLILKAIRESNGFAIAVDDDAIRDAGAEMAREEGVLLCPEGAATYAAYQQALAAQRIKATDRVVLFNCASGLKYPMPDLPVSVLDISQPIDYATL